MSRATVGTAGRARRRRRLAVGAALVAGFALLTPFDGAIYHAADPSLGSRAALESRGWYMVLRNIGSLWTWAAVGLLLLTIDLARRAGRPWARGLFVLLGAGVAGLAAEILKLVIGRERPATIVQVDGVDALVYQGHRFRALFSGFVDGSNLGLPSSHAATAAGGAFALAMLAPAPRSPAFALAGALALGCGVTRVLAGAHFATDVYAGIVVGWLAALLLRRPVVGKGVS